MTSKIRPTLDTPLTRLLGIDTPVLLAGMNGVSHSELAAAVTNGVRLHARHIRIALHARRRRI